MNFVQSLEENYRDLASASRQKHPGVKEASERGISRLRQLQGTYIKKVRNGESPTTEHFKHSELLHPILLAANYPNADYKMLDVAFRSLRLLMESHAIQTTDGIHMLRVYQIQSQVVTSYFQKTFKNKKEKENSKKLEKRSSSSWFGWGSSKDTGAVASTIDDNDAHSVSSHASSHNSLPNQQPHAVKGKMSSSSGSSSNAHDSPQMERLALEILSSILQLLELLKDTFTEEEYCNIVHMASQWMFLPKNHKVHQASCTTLSQITSILFGTADTSLRNATWEDLLALSISSVPKSGAFRQSTVRIKGSLAIELMTTVWKNRPNFLPESLYLKTLGVTQRLLQTPNATILSTLRIYQWVTCIILGSDQLYDMECRELFQLVIKHSIPIATDRCRDSEFFEDGYIYDGNIEISEQEEDVLPIALLWKSSLALESVYTILGQDYARLKHLVFANKDDLLHRLTETLSDFITIATSCRYHMMQIVDFLESTTHSSIQPTTIRRAEYNITKYGDDYADAAKGSRTEVLVLGEAVWMAMSCMLRIGECLGKQSKEGIRQSPEIKDVHHKCLEQVFPPSLAVYQHMLKRFIGSRDLVELSLEGYSILAQSCCRLNMERKVLITSLSKLSLPAWGKHDSSSLLQDHHIQALVCLLKIIHNHCDCLAPEWEVIMWTLEELSVLEVSSPLMSEIAYNGSLAVAATYERLALFTTSMDDTSLVLLGQALTEICRIRMSKRDVVGVSQTVLPEISQAQVELKRAGSGDDNSNKESIGGKIMSMGARVIYGSSSNDEKETEDATRSERPKRIYYQDYSNSFLSQLSTSKVAVRANQIGRLPFCLVLLSHITLVNLFRPPVCTKELLETFTDLAQASPAVRPFVMDLTAMITMNKLSSEQKLPIECRGRSKVVVDDPTQSQLLAVAPIDTSFVLCYHETSQIDILSQLCSTIRETKSADMAKSSLEVLSTILEGTGQTLKGKVWPLVIDSIASLSGDSSLGAVDRTTADWAASCLLAFRTLKLIIDDFLDCLPSESTTFDSNVSLLNACCSFVDSKHDINTSLTAIGQLWTIAEQGANSIHLNRVLSRFVMLSSDDRAEVRNASINTLFSCIGGRGTNFTVSDWEFCLNDAIFRVLDVVLQKLDDDRLDSDDMKGQGKYKVRQHHSRDSGEKMWLASLVLVLRGLSRVLRSFFDSLLAEIDSLAWFPNVWERTLEVALQAGCQSGDGRETLDLRVVGIEMIILCCQLSSVSGVQAGLTPARVGTHMEVVNGALRSVRMSQPSRQASLDRELSAAALTRCRALFDKAFLILENLARFVQTENADADVTLQIVSRLGSNMQKLYACCKDYELKPVKESKCLEEMAADFPDSQQRLRTIKDSESRFISIVKILLEKARGDPKAKFLNQGQRVCLEILKGMALNGSCLAFCFFVDLSGSAFFARKDTETDHSDNVEHEEGSNETTVTLLNFECASVVAESISCESVSDQCRSHVLDLVLSSFLHYNKAEEEKQVSIRKHYKLFLPVVEQGLRSACILREKLGSEFESRLSSIYTQLTQCCRLMLRPVDIGRGLTKVQRVQDVISVQSIAVKGAPHSVAHELASVLLHGGNSSLNAAKSHAARVGNHPEGDFARKSKRHRDELLKLFASCFEGSCHLTPAADGVLSISKQILRDATSSGLSPSVESVSCEAAMIVIESIAEHEAMVMSLFAPLCEILVLEGSNPKVQSAIVQLFSDVHIHETIASVQSRCDEANRRAALAEKRVEELSKELDDARTMNTSLQEDLKEAGNRRSSSIWSLGVG